MPALVLIERFSGFQLQDKHNASIKRTWRTKSDGKNKEFQKYARGKQEKTSSLFSSQVISNQPASEQKDL